MRKTVCVLTSIGTLVLATAVFAQPKPGAPAAAVKPADPASTPGMTEHVLKTPKEIQWVDGPPSLPKGAKVSVIEGDPGKAGPFTMRAQVPANYKIPAHTHPAIEHVTVISGEVFMGMGEKLDEKTATKLPAGSFAVMPVKHAHFFFTKKKAEFQLHGIGPWGINYINPADDPRNAPPAPAPATPPAKK